MGAVEALAPALLAAALLLAADVLLAERRLALAPLRPARPLPVHCAQTRQRLLNLPLPWRRPPSPGRVPGQWTLVRQILDRRCSPGHGRPPWLAAGLLHFLSDTWSPTPQVTGQDEKGVHALQPPSTETDRQRR